MWARVGFAFFAVVAFMAAVPVAAQNKITGSITDSQGAAILGARIFIHWDHSGSEVGLTTNSGIKQDVVLTTNASGAFSTNLPPGFYDVFISAAAFSPDCRKVRLNTGQTLTLNPKLNISALVIKEIGDKIQ